MNSSIILVDDSDRVLGTMDKLQAHVTGKLHRAFSIFIFNSKGELLMQQRAFDKYHSGGKWSNTCCSHPSPGEQTIDGAHRRLWEEMGLQCNLRYGFPFIYRAEFTNGLIEHEYDHVFFGVSDELPAPDPREVAAYQYINVDALLERLDSEPGDYSEWLKVCFDKVLASYNNQM